MQSAPIHSSECEIQQFPWGSLHWVASAGLGNSTTMTVGLATIAAGHTNPLHRHLNCDEVLHLLSGKIRHTLGAKEYLLGPGDTISIPMGEWHNATALGNEEAKMVICFSSAEGKTGGKNVIGPRLYNLAKDIHEDNDLSKSMPEKVNELQTKWNAWDKLNVKPKWGAETKAGGGKAKKKKGSDD